MSRFPKSSAGKIQFSRLTLYVYAKEKDNIRNTLITAWLQLCIHCFWADKRRAKRGKFSTTKTTHKHYWSWSCPILTSFSWIVTGSYVKSVQEINTDSYKLCVFVKLKDRLHFEAFFFSHVSDFGGIHCKSRKTQVRWLLGTNHSQKSKCFFHTDLALQ